MPRAREYAMFIILDSRDKISNGVKNSRVFLSLMNSIAFNSISDYITVMLTFFSSFLALLMFIKYLIIRDKTRGEILLCIFISCVFIWRLSDGFAYLNLFRIYIPSPVAFVVFTSISYFFTGPLIYFYGKFYVSHQVDSMARMAPHLVIPVLLAILLISTSVYSYWYDLGDSYIARVDKATVSAATVLLCTYVLFILIRILSLLRNGSITGRGFLVIIGVIFLLIISAGLAYLWGNKLVLSVLVMAALVVHFLFVDVIAASLQIVQDEAVRGSYVKSQIRDVDVEEIIERIEIMMSWDRIYHDDRLSLKSFAERLEITPHQLSDILNAKMGLAFYPFINNYRINEARDLLMRDKDTPVIKVAYQVGFNSLSTFYTTFKKITGMSPGSYQKFIKK